MTTFARRERSQRTLTPGRGVSPDLVFDTALLIVFAAILGARIMYVIFHREEMTSFLDLH